MGLKPVAEETGVPYPTIVLWSANRKKGEFHPVKVISKPRRTQSTPKTTLTVRSVRGSEAAKII